MLTTRRKLAVPFVAAGAIAFLCFVFWSGTQSRTPTTRITDARGSNNCHVLVADRQGFFEDNAIIPQVVDVEFAKLAMDALLANSADYAVVVDTNVALALFETDDIAILAELSEPMRNMKIVVRTDRQIQTGSDLRGKTIAVKKFINAHLFLDKYLEANNVSVADVTILDVPPSVGKPALERGEVDAAVLWEPFAFQVLSANPGSVFVLEDDSPTYWHYKMMLVTRRSHLEKNKDEALGILRALDRADQFIAEHPDTVVEMLAEQFGMNSTEVRLIFDDATFRLQLTPRLLEMITYELEWFRSQAEISGTKEPKVDDVNELIWDGLRDVRPGAFQL